MELRRLMSEVSEMNEVAKRIYFAVANLEDETSGKPNKVVLLPRDASFPDKPVGKRIMTLNSVIVTVLEFSDMFIVFMTTKTNIFIVQIEDKMNGLLGSFAYNALQQAILTPYPVSHVSYVEEGINTTDLEVRSILNQVIDDSRPNRVEAIYEEVAYHSAIDERSESYRNAIDDNTTVAGALRKMHQLDGQ